MVRRSEDRTRTLLPAQITGAGRVIECVLKDVSAKGARLRVPDASAVPDRFELFLKQTGEFRPATVRWRRVTEVGVSFVPERRAFGRRAKAPPFGTHP